MSDTYTKLFRSLAASTIVGEPLPARWLWVMLLSQADARGCVYGSVPGLARLANLSIPEVEDALERFQSPDPYSRTRDHEGRRIEAIDGGWRLLNHAKYAGVRNESERREYKRQWDRANRPSGHARQSDTVRHSPTESDKSDAADTTNTNTRTTPTEASNSSHAKEQLLCKSVVVAKRQTARAGALAECEQFAEFWRQYPRKVAKAEAAKAWRQIAADKSPELAERIVSDVRERRARHTPWHREPQFIPHPATYLRGRRFEDAIEQLTEAQHAKQSTIERVEAKARARIAEIDRGAMAPHDWPVRGAMDWPDGGGTEPERGGRLEHGA